MHSFVYNLYLANHQILSDSTKYLAIDDDFLGEQNSAYPLAQMNVMQYFE